MSDKAQMILSWAMEIASGTYTLAEVHDMFADDPQMFKAIERLAIDIELDEKIPLLKLGPGGDFTLDIYD
jgi:hypothetical protein